jgi:hypothetical protein
MKGLVRISGLALAVVMCAVIVLTRPTEAQTVRCFNSCTSARAFADNTCAAYATSCHISAGGVALTRMATAATVGAARVLPRRHRR